MGSFVKIILLNKTCKYQNLELIFCNINIALALCQENPSDAIFLVSLQIIDFLCQKAFSQQHLHTTQLKYISETVKELSFVLLFR